MIHITTLHYDPLIAHTFQVIYLYVGQRYHQDKDYLLVDRRMLG